MADSGVKGRLKHIGRRARLELVGPVTNRAARRGRLVRRGLRDRIARVPAPDWRATRDDLAFRYLRGEGIEIGALNVPQRVPPRARVRYVDHASGEELLEIYAEQLPLHDTPLVVPDVVDDGERLATFAAESVDFLIANHMLEHAEDPIDTLRHFLRVLRPQGILFITLPDPRHTFDARRARTTIEHLLRDHREGPEVSRREHYVEWATIIESVPEERVADRVEEFAREGARHHFHVWELETFLAFIGALDLPVDLESAQATDHEFAVVLRKRPAPARDTPAGA